MAQALISGYLREQPVDDLDEFYKQTQQAQWLELRYFQNLADVLSKLFGNKK